MAYEVEARALKIELQSLQVSRPNPDFEGVFEAATKGSVGALITSSDGLLVGYPKRIADLAIKNRMPSMHDRSDFVRPGGLMSYSTDNPEMFAALPLT
jgi:putative tryptophan/tyrosine transport system substrate-binding protein